MEDAPINAGHPTEGDPVMTEYYEATAEQIAQEIAERQEAVELDVLDDDEGFVDDGTADIEDDQSPLTDLEFLRGRVARLTELRAERDRTKIAADNAKKEFEEFQALFFEEYEKSPLKGSIKIDLGEGVGTAQITPRRTQFGRILDRDKAEKYFSERAKTSEYMKQDFRMGRLHELVREHLEQKKPLPEGIDFYTKEYFTITFKD